MRKIILFCIGVLLLGCSKDSPPKGPEAALLTFPERNSECTTGTDLNAVTSQVEFRWQTAKFTDTYELRVTNVNSGVSQTVTTAALSARLPLEKGALHRWNVLTRNEKTEVVATSDTWQFYNAGTETSYAPFPAEIVSPESGASVIRDINNEITLQWIGADVDNDIAGYEIYMDTNNPPATIVGSPSVSINSIQVTAASESVYYWKVITRDREGNTSDSGVFSFRAL
ncbi:MAG: hypothetical protein KJP14_08775 [Eudoraea sp.]|nr:hypothetical protein [Eudoraea sp.]MBT8210607.1 hypothetical protein [Eudoraea sp.]